MAFFEFCRRQAVCLIATHSVAQILPPTGGLEKQRIALQRFCGRQAARSEKRTAFCEFCRSDSATVHIVHARVDTRAGFPPSEPCASVSRTTTDLTGHPRVDIRARFRASEPCESVHSATTLDPGNAKPARASRS